MEAVWTESLCGDRDGRSSSVSSFPHLTLAIRASSQLASTSVWASRRNSRAAFRFALELFSEST